MQIVPVISIIIPTHCRPQLLPRAIYSCLAGFADGEVEVIVVPNGPDNSWQQSLAGFGNNVMVKILPITDADANTARNHGLENASGRYVRFLDDDDLLLSDGSKTQYRLMDETGADICTGAVSLVDDVEIEFDVFKPSTLADYVSSLLCRSTETIPVAHVFRREFIKHLRWLPKQPFLQDQLWMHIVCRYAEINWVKTQEVVGVWHHHRGYRISIGCIASPQIAHETTGKILSDTASELMQQNRLDAGRSSIAAAEIWKLAHPYFHRAPFYWHRIMRLAYRLDKNSCPDAWPFHYGFAAKLNPLFVEWLVMPIRWAIMTRNWFRNKYLSRTRKA